MLLALPHHVEVPGSDLVAVGSIHSAFMLGEHAFVRLIVTDFGSFYSPNAQNSFFSLLTWHAYG